MDLERYIGILATKSMEEMLCSLINQIKLAVMQSGSIKATGSTHSLVLPTTTISRLSRQIGEIIIVGRRAACRGSPNHNILESLCDEVESTGKTACRLLLQNAARHLTKQQGAAGITPSCSGHSSADSGVCEDIGDDLTERLSRGKCSLKPETWSVFSQKHPKLPSVKWKDEQTLQRPAPSLSAPMFQGSRATVTDLVYINELCRCLTISTLQLLISLEEDMFADINEAKMRVEKRLNRLRTCPTFAQFRIEFFQFGQAMECLARITGICLTNLKDGSAQVAISSARHLLENGMRTLLSAFKTSYRHPRSALARLMRDRCVERMLASLAEITDPTRQVRQKRRLSEQDDVSPSNASNGKDSRSKYGKECTNNRSVSKNLSEIRQFFANQLVNNFDFVRRAGKINLNDPSCRSHRKTRLQVIRKEIADRIRIIVDCSYIDSSDHRRILQAHFNFRKSLDSFLHYNDFYGVYNLSGSDLNESMEQLDEALWSATRDQISRTVAIVSSQEILCFLSVGESPTMSRTSHHTQRSTATLHLVPLNSLDEQKFLLHEFRKANLQIRGAFELACECITDSNQLNMIASAKEQITTSESDVATAYTLARTLPGDESTENLQAFLEQWKRIAITCLTGLNNVLSAHVIAKNNTVSASSGSF